MEQVHAAIVHRNTLRAILRADADKMLTSFAQELNGFDDDRTLKALGLQHRLGGGLFERGIGGSRAGLGRSGGFCWLGERRADQREGACTGGGGEKAAAGESSEGFGLHRMWLS